MFTKLGAFAQNILAIISVFGILSVGVIYLYTPYVVQETYAVMQPDINKRHINFEDSLNLDNELFKTSMEAQYVIQFDSVTISMIDMAVYSGMERYDLQRKETDKDNEGELLKKMDMKIDSFFGVKIPVISIITGKVIGYEYAARIEGKIVKYYEPTQ